MCCSGDIADIKNQHYSTIMPLLLNVLQNANAPDYKTLRVKAMECAGLIGKSLGTDLRASLIQVKQPLLSDATSSARIPAR